VLSWPGNTPRFLLTCLFADAFLVPVSTPAAVGWIKTLAEVALGQATGRHVWIDQETLTRVLRARGFKFSTRGGKLHVGARLAWLKRMPVSAGGSPLGVPADLVAEARRVAGLAPRAQQGGLP
jgi:hypothetical protein